MIVQNKNKVVLVVIFISDYYLREIKEHEEFYNHLKKIKLYI